MEYEAKKEIIRNSDGTVTEKVTMVPKEKKSTK